MKLSVKWYLVFFVINVTAIAIFYIRFWTIKLNIEGKYSNDIFESQVENFPRSPTWGRKTRNHVRDNDLVPLSEIIPRPNSIYFLETSAASAINPRVACSIESAAKHHPNNNIYIVMTSPYIDVNRLTNQLIDKYVNIHIKYVSINSFLDGTPLHMLWRESRIQKSDFLVSHLSDVLRYAAIYRFGGTYADTDVIFLKPLPDEQLVPNFISKENPNLPHLAAGLFRFQYNHPVITKVLEFLATRFDGIDWGANGPKAITAVMYDLCNVKDADLMSPEKCLGTKIYKSTFFYKIPWRNWRDIFDSSKTTEILMSLNDSIVLHTWGRFSSTIQTIDQNGMSALSFIAKNNCPVSYPFIIE